MVLLPEVSVTLLVATSRFENKRVQFAPHRRAAQASTSGRYVLSKAPGEQAVTERFHPATHSILKAQTRKFSKATISIYKFVLSWPNNQGEKY